MHAGKLDVKTAGQRVGGKSLRLFTIGEAAREIGRSTRTIQRWEDAGEIEPARDGKGRRYFTCEQLEELRQRASERRGGLVPR
jgi:hypothetical protein